MTYKPLFTVPESPQLRTCHEEYAPVHPPFLCFIFSICLPEERHDLVPALIHVRQPGLRSFVVVTPAYTPMLLGFEVIVEIQQQVIAGHHATVEKILRHPVGIVFYLVEVAEVSV